MAEHFFEKPILNSPYEYPARHWELDSFGQPTNRIVDNRRLAEFITPIPKPKKQKQNQKEIVFDEGKGLSTEKQRYDPTPIINAIRRQTPVINTPAARSQPVPVQGTPPPAQQPRNGYANGRNRIATVTNGAANGNGRRGVNATEAQCRAIYAICKSQGIDMAGVLADFNVADPKDLHVKDASRLIDQLKSQNGNGTASH